MGSCFLLRLNALCEHRQAKHNGWENPFISESWELFWVWTVPVGDLFSNSRSALNISFLMHPCSSEQFCFISTYKSAGQIHVILSSLWFGSLLINSFYLLSKSTGWKKIMMHIVGFSKKKNPIANRDCIKFSVLTSSVAGGKTQIFLTKSHFRTQFVKMSICDVLIKLVTRCQRFLERQKCIP